MNIHEVSENRLERLAATFPLPTIPEHDLIYFATEFAKANAKRIGLDLIGLGKSDVKTAWKSHLRYLQESRRFNDLLQLCSGRYDQQRGKWLIWLDDETAAKLKRIKEIAVSSAA